MDYNLVVIGAGSGGLVSSYIASVVKSKVALIERHKMGGDCLNTGCVPSKALIRSTTFLSHVNRHKDFGFKNATAEFDFAEIMERVQSIIRKIEPHDSVERYSKLGVDCLQGEAKILSPNKVSVDGKVITTKNIIIATGGVPAVPRIPGIENIDYYHTDNIWTIRKQPKKLIVIGGGPIGCELGQAFARMGTKVILIQRHHQLLPREDDDVIEVMERHLEKEGAELRLSTITERIEVRDGKKFLIVKKKGDEKEEEIEFDELLSAVGRVPRTKGFGLEELGVELDDRGRIRTDQYSRTNIKNIFACGDVTSPYQFTHMAAHQAWYCAVNALFSPFAKFKVDLSITPWCTYTDPEIGRLGLNEKEAKEKNIPYELSVYPLDDLDRAITDSEDYGMIKVLTPPGKDKILGVTICGYHAGDLLPEFVFAKKYGMGLNKILGTIHVYPTMGESIKYAAGIWKKAHKPEGLLNLIGKFHSFRRGK